MIYVGSTFFDLHDGCQGTLNEDVCVRDLYKSISKNQALVDTAYKKTLIRIKVWRIRHKTKLNWKIKRRGGILSRQRGATKSVFIHTQAYCMVGNSITSYMKLRHGAL